MVNDMTVTKSTAILLWIVTILYWFPANLRADQENIRFQRIALEQGLSQETILAAYQDKEGYMWFGTQEGLNRFDGYQFKVFTNNSRQASSLSSDWIYVINETDDGQLWVGTILGVNVFDKATQTFEHFRHDPLSPNSLSNDIVHSIVKDSSGTMWVGTDSGLNKYNTETNDFTRYSGIGAVKDKEDKISAIAEDISGALWIGTVGNGLFRFDPKTETVTISTEDLERLTGIDSRIVNSVFIDSKQRLWIGTIEDGLSVIYLDGGIQEDQKYLVWKPKATSDLVVSHMYEDKVGTVWIATEAGLFRLNKDSDTFQVIKHQADNPYSLSTDKITYLLQDRGGVFWVGSYGGLNKWNTATAKFDHIRVTADKSRSLSTNSTNAFYDAGDSKIWIGTYLGLNLVNNKTGEISHFLRNDEDENSIRSNKIMSLFARNNDEVWIGYRDKGLSVFNHKNNEFTHYSQDSSNNKSINASGVTSMAPANKGKIWVGTFGGGLNLFDPSTDVFDHYLADEKNPQSISSDKIMSVTEDAYGLLWLGTWESGISLFNPTTATAINIKNKVDDPSSLGSNTILAIIEDSNKNIWVGTQGGGLNKLSFSDRVKGNYHFEKITRYEGLPSNVVYGIVEDDNGFLWLSTNRGISKFNPMTNELLNYDSSHGLQGNEFNSGAYYKAEDKKIYFGGSNGVTAFYPEDISPNSHVPPVVLTKFQKLNEVIVLDSSNTLRNSIQISHEDYLVAFEFAGLDYASPLNNLYKYKLEGFDQNWIEADSIRKATYTNLPAGRYIFRVKASNNDGVWNEQGAAVALTVLPAPWYSWWAYLIYVAIALGLLYGFYRSYLNKQKKEANYRLELEKEVENRTIELSEVNEQLLSASVTDQLTGLHNRRYLNSIVEQQCASVFREFEEHLSAGKLNAENGPRLFFLMFDLDGFKPINDTYGHDAGDKVICQVGELLKTVCRKSDSVIRWGGDEFLVMGRVEQVSEIELLAERLRSSVASYGFDIDLKQKMHLSCSIGYSMYPFSHHYPDSLSWEQVHLLADNALYKSKESGRNQWTGISQTVEIPPVSIMNTLTRDIDSMIKQGYVTVKQAGSKHSEKVSQITSFRTKSKGESA
jgi:diguanylate cyclase (GGDEF)-like protein